MDLGREAIEPLLERACTSHFWLRERGKSPNHKRKPLEEENLTQHLNGGAYSVGLCPIAPGASVTRIALFDFDAHGGYPAWPDLVIEVQKILAVAQRQGLKPIPFRSSGGRGIHAFFIWEADQDAYSVRNLLRTVLEACAFKNGTKGVSAMEAEVFPKQDAVPQGRWGSMFILPYFGESVALTLDTLEPTEEPTWRLSDPVPPKPRPQGPAPRGTPDKDGGGISAAISVPESLTRVAMLLSQLDPNRDYELWLKDLAAVFQESEGSEEGFELADGWSAGGLTYPGSDELRKKWASFKLRDDGTSIEWLESQVRAGQQARAADFPDEEEPAPGAGEVDSTNAAPGQGTEPGLKFRFESLAEFISRPAPTWLIPGILPRASLGVIYGLPGSGKTFWSMDLAFTAAEGLPWRGRAVSPMRVGYLAIEAPNSVAMRAKRLAERHEIPAPRARLMLSGHAISLLQQDHTHIIAAVKAMGGCDLLFIDTLAQATAGANENDPETMGKAIKSLRKVHEATKAMCVLVHHAGKDSSKGLRGHSSLEGAADVIIEIYQTNGGRMARTVKMKDFESDKEFPFQLLPGPAFTTEDGTEYSTCTVEQLEPRIEETSSPSFDRRRPNLKGTVERMVWEAYGQRLVLQDGYVSANELIEDVVPLLVVTTGTEDRRAERAARTIESMRERKILQLRERPT